MSENSFHVLTRPGDALAEVEAAARSLAARGLAPEDAGLHKAMYVTRADQTVVMATEPEAPIAGALRARGWAEPGARPSHR